MKKTALLLLLLTRLVSDAFSQDVYQGSTPETMFSSAVEKRFLQEFNEKFQRDFDAPAQYAKAQTLGVDGWEMNLFTARKAQMAFYKDNPQVGQFSENFKNYLENCIRWNYWHLLLAWPIVRTNAQATQQTVPSLPAVMLEGFDESKANDESAMPAEPYRNFLFFYVTYFNSKARNFAKYTQNDLDKILPEKAGFARQHLSGLPYQYALTRLLLDNCEKAAPSSVRTVFATLTATPNSATYADLVKARCGAVMARKDEPKPEVAAKKKAVDPNVFSFVNQNGESVTLDDFKGKVVYLDVWASWCGPCIGEVPHSKKLYERLTKKQLEKIAFLYISIDDSETNWKNAIKAHQLPGDQGWSAGGWRSRIVQYFGIQSIPRYILIDKKGQMADLNAKRPSSAEAVWQDIMKLLEE
ncbi:TlpA family protein disulfide reductase [Larkinella rosea]|uniref:TlpA family protein disulfide reductase n=1 Tax=Larkinella rosea TaxID=2025312 RepID=A0A3P1C2A0_9BACT|nr:TlpA disulfide reductase family protein [Larkinella rosea]RRB07193.1 TlpA family protein disulfide reductase [Larkinella rosea]